jgi:hypothetical protein
MPKRNTPKNLLLLVAAVIVFSFVAYWLAWRHGIVIASVNGTYHDRYCIREIPTSTDMLSMIFGLNDSPLYRMEVWRFSHCITDCKTSSGDSYRAKTARIDLSPERCTFYLDDTPWMTFTAHGEWKHE